MRVFSLQNESGPVLLIVAASKNNLLELLREWHPDALASALGAPGKTGCWYPYVTSKGMSRFRLALYTPGIGPGVEAFIF